MAVSGASVMQRCSLAARWFTTVERAAPALCGRGDKKTKKGKRFKGSYGNSRPKKEKMIERIKDKVEVPRLSEIPMILHLCFVLLHVRGGGDFLYVKFATLGYRISSDNLRNKSAIMGSPRARRKNPEIIINAPTHEM
ncbi:30S ribosomal protein S31, mitochondrial, partial [Mucuna pruriens]